MEKKLLKLMVFISVFWARQIYHYDRRVGVYKNTYIYIYARSTYTVNWTIQTYFSPPDTVDRATHNTDVTYYEKCPCGQFASSSLGFMVAVYLIDGSKMCLLHPVMV